MVIFAPILRAAANERGGGEPAVRAVDAGGAGEGVQWGIM
jgi:hypothetical protein